MSIPNLHYTQKDNISLKRHTVTFKTKSVLYPGVQVLDLGPVRMRARYILFNRGRTPVCMCIYSAYKECINRALGNGYEIIRYNVPS